MIEIPHYKIEKELGEGGMSTVYLATHELLDRQVALKVMSPYYLQDGSFKECFINEGRIISKLNHPHIIHIYDIGVNNDACYMAIELLEGDTLREKIDHKSLSIPDIHRIITQISGALHAAHSQNFIHRDIKPSNILFRKDGAAVLTDFGISKVQDTEGEMTTLGFTAGTPSYMPPEYSMGETLDHRADIYSLGVVFYEMLTGEKPYKATTAAAMSYAHVNGPIPELEPKLAHYQQIINRVLAKKPKDRFNTVMDFVKAVERSDISMAETIITRRENTFVAENNNVTPSKSNVDLTERTGLDGVVNKKENTKKWMLIVGGVLSLLAIIGLVGFFISAPAKKVVTIKNIVDRPVKAAVPTVEIPVVNKANNEKDIVIASVSGVKPQIPEVPLSKVPLSSNPLIITPQTLEKPASIPPETIVPNTTVVLGSNSLTKAVPKTPSIINNPLVPTITTLTPTIKPVKPIVKQPIINERKLTKDQTTIVNSLLDNSLLRATMTVKEMIRINKSESIIEDIKNLKTDSGRTKFITDTHRKIATSKLQIKNNTEIYYQNLNKLKSYQVSLVLELLKETEEGASSKTTNQGVFDILNTHLEKSAKGNLTLIECKEDFSDYSNIISSTL